MTTESVIADLLRSKSLTLACAESCTGGMIISKMIDHPGVSDVLIEGAVTYSNDAKINRLGVDAQLIRKHGAVSREVAAAMAEGVVRSSGAKVGLATTGIAGPGGGTVDKPVGLVYIGLCLPSAGVLVKKLIFDGDRASVRRSATTAALDFLRLELIKENANA